MRFSILLLFVWCDFRESFTFFALAINVIYERFTRMMSKKSRTGSPRHLPSHETKLSWIDRNPFPAKLSRRLSVAFIQLLKLGKHSTMIWIADTMRTTIFERRPFLQRSTESFVASLKSLSVRASGKMQTLSKWHRLHSRTPGCSSAGQSWQGASDHRFLPAPPARR